MTVRRKLGNRVVSPVPPRLPRLGPRRLVAHACFHCRKSFKLDPERPHSCPQCASALYEMGRSFRVPQSTNAEQWRKVQALYAYGFRFFGNGAGTGERLPARYKDVAAFVARNPKHRLRIAAQDSSLMPDD